MIRQPSSSHWKMASNWFHSVTSRNASPMRHVRRHVHMVHRQHQVLKRGLRRLRHLQHHHNQNHGWHHQTNAHAFHSNWRRYTTTAARSVPASQKVGIDVSQRCRQTRVTNAFAGVTDPHQQRHVHGMLHLTTSTVSARRSRTERAMARTTRTRRYTDMSKQSLAKSSSRMSPCMSKRREQNTRRN